MADQETGSESVEHEEPGCSEVLTPTEVMLKLGVKLDAAKLAVAASVEQLIELVKELDDEVGLWAMTILLGRYFEGQMKLASQAVPDLYAASDETLLEELEAE